MDPEDSLKNSTAPRAERTDARRPRATKGNGAQSYSPFACGLTPCVACSHTKVDNGKSHNILPSFCSSCSGFPSSIKNNYYFFALSIHPFLHRQPTSSTRPKIISSWWIKDHLWMLNVRHMPSPWDTWV